MYYNYETIYPIKQHRAKTDADNQKVRATFYVPDESFESTKAESISFLQKIDQDLDTIYTSVNKKIEAFSAHILEKVNQQFQNVKEQIYVIVGTIFNNTQTIFQKYIDNQLRQYANKLIQIKSSIARERKNIKIWKDQILEKNWWAIVGTVMSNKQNLEQKVYQLSEDDKQFDLQKWKFKGFRYQNFRRLEQELRELIRVQN